jgi:hypothetical protein
MNVIVCTYDFIPCEQFLYVSSRHASQINI